MDQIAFSNQIAIVGMNGRFPGARTIHEFWENLRGGVEGISFFTDQELQASGIDPALYGRSNYVKAGAVLDDIEMFDAAFFGISAREAALMDPQQRFFLECAWEVLEHAGYDPERYRKRIGVFAGASMDTYLLSNVVRNREVMEEEGVFQIGLGNEKDYLATRISYKLNLRGPGISISTACSTSLVAVHMAVQSLLNNECDMALAGGVAINVPHKMGYLYQEGGIVSPDGHCRAFDEHAQGTIRGNGVGVVLLKRFTDAVKDNDTIYAVIKGSAVNNDGSAKVGFTAPSIQGQARAIAEAQAVADIQPEQVTYIEAHGTGTELGDPIEIEALKRVFRTRTQKQGFCAIGSVKTNIGHLDAAAGITGLIKTVLALTHKQIPPSLHFVRPNARIDFTNSPFYVNIQLSAWESNGTPRTAGVSSFGIGGTNAHVIVQEAPSIAPSVQETKPYYLLTLSARTETALAAMTRNLAEHLKQHPDAQMANVAYVLQSGRKQFAMRRTVLCQKREEAIQALEMLDAEHVVTGEVISPQPSVIFLFPGQGAQHLHMAFELYQHEPVFHKHLERCMDALQPHLKRDLRAIVYPRADEAEEARHELTQTALAQPALFALEYALAQMWMEWGVRPQAFIGHSIGEYVAATLAGVFALEDAARLVVLRGEMMQAVPRGAMLAVSLSPADLQPFLHEQLSLAAINSPTRCVVAGTTEAIETLSGVLAAKGIVARTLHTSHAFHSSMMDSLIKPFAAEVKKIQRTAPTLPFVSNVTGTWISAAEATDPDYWSMHLRQTVQFATGLQTLLNEPQRIFLEVGPGSTLSTLAKQHPARKSTQRILTSLPHVREQSSDLMHVLQTLGHLWVDGIQIEWTRFASEGLQRIPLPTYPFERQRYWIDEPKAQTSSAASHVALAQNEQPKNHGASSQEGKTMEIAVSDSHVPVQARRKEILAKLKGIFGRLLGTDFTTTDDRISFFEIGVDSLLLMQVSQRIQDTFAQKVPFRLLMDEYATFAALATHLDQIMPPDVLSAPVSIEPVFTSAEQPPLSKMPSSPSHNATTVGEKHGAPQVGVSRVEAIVEQQLQVMAQQLEMLRTSMLSSSHRDETVPEAVQMPAVAQGQLQNMARPLPTAPIADGPRSEPLKVENGVPAQTTGTEAEPFVPYRPRQTGAIAGLTARQQQHIEALIESLVNKTGGSKKLAQEYRRFHADNRGTAGFNLTFKEMVYPLVVERAEGAHVWDVDENEYIDITMGFGALLFGHSPSFVMDVLQEQSKRGIRLGLQSDLVGKVAQLFCALTGTERVSFCNSGTEAVMTALRLARAVTGRSKIVVFAGSFHGTFDGVLVRTQETAGKDLRTMPLAPGIPESLIGDVTSLYFGRAESLEILRTQAHELAAVLVELPQSRRPDLLPTQFLQELRKITQEAGATLIFDEVVAGFRMHPGGAQALFGVRADLVTYGKALGGGMPVAAIAGKAELMAAVDGGIWDYGDGSYPSAIQTFFAGTYFKHPFLMPVLWAILNKLKDSGPQLQERLNQHTAQLVQRLDCLFAQAGVDIHMVSFGSLFRFEFGAAYKAIEINMFFYHLLAKGVYIAESRNCFLSTAHTDKDLDGIVRAVEETVQGMLDGGFFANPVRNRAGEVRLLPMTEQQKELWIMAQFGEDASRAYNQALTLHLKGALQVSALRRSLHKLVQRHEALRTTFSSEGDYQRILPSLSLDMMYTDASTLSGDIQEKKVAEVQADEMRRPLDLEQGPLLRVHLVKLAEEKHLLFFTIHHIIADGSSVGILLEELSLFYAAECSGTKAQLPPVMQYSEYGQWRQKPEQQALRASARAYWLAQYATLPPPLSLPTDNLRPPVKTFNGGLYSTTIDSELLGALKRFSQQHTCTLFTTLLAAYAALLVRLTAQTDLVIALPTLDQALVNSEYMVGHSINLLPLRIKLAGDPMLDTYIRSVKNAVLDAYAQQLYPLSSLVEELNIPRDPGALPLVATSFNLDRASELHFQGLETHITTNTTGFTKFDLAVNIIQTETELLLECSYNTDLFGAETVQRWMGHLEVLLQSMVQSSTTQHFTELPLMTQPQQRQMLFEWNATQKEYPSSQCVHQLFEAQVERTPENVAVICAEQRLTYRELNQRANQLAHWLRTQGVGPDQLVAICMERSLDLLVALFGVLKAGGAYVPLDPGFPKERLQYMLADVQAPVLLTQTSLIRRLPAFAGTTLLLDRDWEIIAQEAIDNVCSEATPDNLAYVIYTSGSLGKPKGVMIHHRGLVNYLNWCTKTCMNSPLQGVPIHSPIGFDLAVTGLFPPLLVGQHLVLLPVMQGAEALVEALTSAQHFSYVKLTPAHLNILNQQEPFEKLTGCVGTLVIGGEMLQGTSLVPWQRSAPETTLINHYGPTETVVGCCTYTLPPGRLFAGIVPIGAPIDNMQAYVLDQYLRPVPLGVAGELYIGGIGVTRGYLHQPGLTAERFIPHPFSQQPGARLYKTGDVARYLPDGMLEVSGRSDHQIKIRGFRIEPGEIEGVLKQHPAVQEAIVIAREDQPGDKRLVAYLVAALDERPVPEQLQQWLHNKVPEYMIPVAFVLLDRLPLTSNGKLDRRALPVPEYKREELAVTYVAPRTTTEETLTHIWSHVLDLKQVGVFDNFFMIGGHSLAATKVMARLRKAFQVDLPLHKLFEYPTVAGLAGQVEETFQSHAVRSRPALVIRPRQALFPLSFAQQRLWFLSQMEPGNPFYNMPVALRMEGPLHVEALERSLAEIVQRHEVLRTTVVLVNGQPMQQIHPPQMLDFPRTDLSFMPPAQQEQRMHQMIRDEATKPFDLSNGPLMRAQLLSLGPVQHILLLTMHHIIFDGWSQEILMQELVIFYEAFAQGLQSPMLTLPRFQYADYALWQREWLQAGALDEQLTYWRQRLAGLPTVLNLPTDRPRPPVQTFCGAVSHFRVSPQRSEAIKQLSHSEGVTLFMILLAAFGILLARYSGQSDVLIGSPVTNRSHVEFEDLIGLFVNTLVLHTSVSGNPSFRTLLKQVRQTTLEAYEHQDLPFEKLVEGLQVERDVSYTPLFQVFFVLQNASAATKRFSDVVLYRLEQQGNTAKFDLTLDLADSDDGLQGAWEYNVDLFDATTIARMSDQFLLLLESLTTDPDQSVMHLNLLPEPEKQLLLHTWNAHTVSYPDESCIHELFAAQVRRTPDAIAVAFDNEQVTYRELDLRANRLAHRLQMLGVSVDSLVGICMERSIEMIVALLSVLKAGGAYVPLDPSYPRERLLFVLEDARLAALLTQRKLATLSTQQTMPILYLDEDKAFDREVPNDAPHAKVVPTNLAYVIYTSGSTGKPKGVQVPHVGVVNFLTSMQREPGITADDTLLAVTTLSFDIAALELFLPMLVGARLELVSRDVAANGAMLMDQLFRSNATMMQATPTTWRLLLEAGWHGYRGFNVLCGGEALPRALANDLLARGITLWNLYGPTETTIWSAICNLTPSEKPVLIGHPIANTQIYLLDAYLQPAPIGVPAELYIGGTGVTRGYLNRPELSAEKFVPDPFSATPGARLYRTGDLARYMADGSLECLGRLDHQVKVHGFRIELEEIEAALSKLASIQECVVVVREDIPTQKRLVAYIVARGKQSPSVSDLRTALKEHLPEYMVPSVFVFLETLPQTPNGKVDRNALPEPDVTRPMVSDAFEPPTTATEQLLAEVWREVLHIEQVGVNDNFFDLGGDSIISVQIIMKANERGLSLVPRQLFQHQTIAALAAALESIPASKNEQGLVMGSIPLTPIQQWFFEQEIPDRQHWNMALVLDVFPHLEPALLRQAIHALLAQHDALRLRFVQKEHGWQQVCSTLNEEVPLDMFDLKLLSESKQAALLETLMTQAQSSLDLAEGPIIKVALFDLGEQKPDKLLIVIHHLAVDIVSWQILLDDLQTAYAQLVERKSVQLPTKTTSFKSWAELLVRYTQTPKVQQQVRYWLDLAGVSIRRLPLDVGAGVNSEMSAHTLTASLSVEETQVLLQAVPKTYHVQVKDVLLTALVQSFAQWTGAPALLLDLEGHGREDILEQVDLSRTVGWFTAITPVYLDLAGVSGAGAALKAIKEQLRMLPDGGIAYSLIRYLARDQKLKSQMERLPQAEIVFNYAGRSASAFTNNASTQFKRAQTASGLEHTPLAKRRYMLEVNGSIDEDRLHIHLTYSENIHHRSTAQHFITSYMEILRKLIQSGQSNAVAHLTVADFPEANLNQKQFESLMTRLKLQTERKSDD